MWEKLKFKYYRWKLGYPCKDEIAVIIAENDISSWTNRLLDTAVLYMNEENSIYDVAIVMGVTRERVRQMLWKIWRKGQK